MFAISLFVLGSMLASMSQSMGQLILFRALQGLGAGGIMPVVLTILGDIFNLQERAKMQGVFSSVWGTAALAGPALGAFLVTTSHATAYFPPILHPILGWRSIFWVNLPFAALAMTVLAFKYHEDPALKAEHAKSDLKTSDRLDLRGLILLTIGATALLTGISLASGVSVPWYIPFAILATGIISTILFIRHEPHAKNPIMSPTLMMHRSIGPAVIVSGLLGLAIFAVETFVPLYVQGGRGWSPGAAAAAVSPVMFAWALAGLIVMPLMMKWGFRKLILIGTFFVLAGLIALLIASLAGAPLTVFIILMFLIGAGFSPISMGTLLTAQEAVDYEQRGIVTSSVTFFRNFGGALGIGLFGALFNLLTTTKLRGITQNTFSAGDLLDTEKLKHIRATHPDLLTTAQSTISHGLYWVFAAMLTAALTMTALSLLIPKKKHPPPPTIDNPMESL
jgi:MFS family permease